MPIVPITAQVAAGDLTNLGAVFTQMTEWLTEILGTITGAPILLIGLGISVVGGAIGLAYRLIRG